MIDLRTVVATVWDAALQEERTVAIPDVASRIIGEYPEVVALESERLVRVAIIRLLKELANHETAEASQLTLFGFPSVIAVPVNDGFRYMRTTKATWPDLVAGAQIRELNVQRAQARLDSYRGALNVVRPVMEGSDLTLAEASSAMTTRPGGAELLVEGAPWPRS